MWYIIIFFLLLYLVVWVIRSVQDSKKRILLNNPEYHRSVIKELLEKVYQSHLSHTLTEIENAEREIVRAKEIGNTKIMKEKEAYIDFEKAFLKQIRSIKRDYENPKSQAWNYSPLNSGNLEEVEEAFNDIFSSASKTALMSSSSPKR